MSNAKLQQHALDLRHALRECNCTNKRLRLDSDEISTGIHLLPDSQFAAAAATSAANASSDAPHLPATTQRRTNEQLAESFEPDHRHRETDTNSESSNSSGSSSSSSSSSKSSSNSNGSTGLAQQQSAAGDLQTDAVSRTRSHEPDHQQMLPDAHSRRLPGSRRHGASD